MRHDIWSQDSHMLGLALSPTAATTATSTSTSSMEEVVMLKFSNYI